MLREIGFINGFRAIAAFWVLTAHCMIWGGANESIIPEPKLAVDLFMIISGYLMALNANVRENKEPLKKPSSWFIFWLRRYFRLAPTYYFSLLLVILSSEYFLSGFQTLRDINPQRWETDTLYDPKLIHYTIENIFYHITFVFGLLPKYSFSTFLPDWSLSLEMQFYFAFPFIYLLMRTWGFFRMGLLLAFAAWLLNKIIIKIAWLNGITWLFHEPSILPMKLQYFLVGILVYEIGWNLTLSMYNKRLYMALALGLTLMEAKHYQLSVLCLPLSVILMLTVQQQTIQWKPIVWMRSLLGSRLMHFASEAAYSVYLFHGFFISLCGLVIAINPGLLSVEPALRVGLMWLFVTLCSYSMAFLIFNYVENPGIRMGKYLIEELQNKLRNKTPLTNE